MLFIQFIQFMSLDDKTVEGAGTIYSGGSLLPEGQWSVRTAKSNIDVIMTQEEMPTHWQEQIKRWGAWADKNLPCSKTMD